MPGLDERLAFVFVGSLFGAFMIGIVSARFTGVQRQQIVNTPLRLYWRLIFAIEPLPWHLVTFLFGFEWH
jgi:hypothetical protein